ncbi:hypothetical protein KC19_11G041200 [Ceratodon purpureus]|uniref:Uncharacterized protein n=1 Tax=Ceratodon purpureus TaxID=3225 RepID=A0A8T0GAU6_CERPU|nr:hypothetical protein KC19_11G041200 [Ceratodon purpureus]
MPSHGIFLRMSIILLENRFRNTSQEWVPIQVNLLDYRDASEFTATFNFRNVLRSVGLMLGYDLDISPRSVNARSRSSPRHNENASQQALMMASSSVQFADYGVTDYASGRQFLVVEMERPYVFRRSANSATPNLCLAFLEASRHSPLTATIVSVEPLLQLYRNMQGMKLAYGIISSFDLAYTFLKAYPTPVPGS